MTTKLGQFIYEADCWKRMLEFVAQENLHCKNRLTEVIELNGVDPEFLASAETYLDNLIQIETIVLLITNDVTAYQKMLEHGISENGSFIKTVIVRRKAIQHEIRTLETEFRLLKSRFDDFLMDVLPPKSATG